ncbi:MAG: DEAD/DEAH box helicase [Spirochaetaceae bacterium]|jgi:ATP-dependent RNA helicase RhlB|nr:DEAD/DEAH box helicase [Spirochaetaceae bacterium]
MEFRELNLHPDLQRGIADAEYTLCTSVQEQVLTNAFGGQDLYVQSQTGTGKTAAFLIVIFQRLLSESLLKGKKAIILVPTRELAIQVEEEALALGKYLPFKVGSFYGGVGYGAQQQLLRDNVQILVGTPGRVLDLNQSGQMNLMDIAFLVLDEADRMFDMGFYPDLRKLIKVVPPADRRQTMLFSATLNAWVKNLAWEYTKSPYEIEIAPETVTVDEVDQVLYHVPSKDKTRLLLGIFRQEQPESAIVFCNTKRQTEILAKRLQRNGLSCEFIMGDLPQTKRFKIIEDIKEGHVRYLVATDVAARGIDIEGLALVINYDLPAEAENYVHRIGRTARAGKTGKAISLVGEQDVYELGDIERYIGKKIPALIPEERLYAQDSSEGIRMHPEGTERRGPSSDDRRRNRSSQPQGSGGRRRAEEGGEGRRSRERGQGRELRASGRKVEGPVLKKTQDPDYQDVSHLSFEERMAYYKQKYEIPPSVRKPREPQESKASPREGSAKTRGEEHTKRRRSRPRSEKRRDLEPVALGAEGPRIAAMPVSPDAASTEARIDGRKEGIIARMFGLFHKKNKRSPEL